MQLQLCLHWKPSLPNLTKSKHMEDSDENNSSLAILYIWAVISKCFFPPKFVWNDWKWMQQSHENTHRASMSDWKGDA